MLARLKPKIWEINFAASRNIHVFQTVSLPIENLTVFLEH